MDSKSDNWREGEKGQAYQDWLEQREQELSTIEFSENFTLDDYDVSYETLNALPEQVEL